MKNVETLAKIEKALTEKYGPLMSVANLAECLDRSPDGLRISLSSDPDWAKAINAAKHKLGRRVYFKTPEIALAFNGQ
jgi:hypothetical protein